jgi:hypothetical protein
MEPKSVISKRTLLPAFCLGLAFAALAVPAGAHHSFAMFDREKPATISGTIKEFQWTNPHVWIQVMVPDAKGVEQEWGVECTSVNFMRRQGWEKESLKPGDKVKMVIFPLKDGSKGGQFNKMVELNGSPNNLPGYQQRLEGRK